MMRKIILLILPFLWMASAFAQLSGVYTINSNASANADYTSLSAAASALSAGVSGPVVFEVAPGTYEEYVTINAISGADSSRRVVFRGMGADNQQVVLTSNAGYTTNNTLKLNGADFVTFENMTVTTQSPNYAVLLRFSGSAHRNRFENVRFVGVEVPLSSSDNDKNLVYMDNGDGVYCNGNEFHGCQFLNGCIALYLQGKNMSQFNTGVVVENCTFSNQQFKSVYVTFFNDVVVRGNSITNANDFKTDYNAIDIFQCYRACLFENNIINVTRTTSYTTVFRLRPCVGDSLNHVVVRNNIVNLHSDATSPSYCFNISNNNSSYIDFAHNTLKCWGTGSNGNIYLQNNGTHLTFYNNLLVNESGGYVFRFVTNSLTERYSDYNRISFNGVNVGRRGTVDYATLQQWTDSTGLDAHSALCNPSFVETQDLHITDANSLQVAHPLAYVPLDIDGDTRSLTPCAGADEYVVGVNLPPVAANPIPDVQFDTFPAAMQLSVAQVFDDPDDDNDSIVVSVCANSNPSVVAATLVADTLSLVRLTTAGGASTITLQAISNGDTAQTSFSVTCVAQDLPPVVVAPLSPIVFADFPQTLKFDLTGVFDDPDNNNLFMVYNVTSGCSDISAMVDMDDSLVVSRLSPNAFSDTLEVSATSNGKTVLMLVPVSGAQVSIQVAVASFEDVTLSPQGYWIPAQEGDNQMMSGGWVFTNYYSSYFWGGFTASNRTDTLQTGMNAQYTSVPGTAYNGSSHYAVAYTMGVPTVISAADGQAHTVTGCYVTNNLWAYQDMRDGSYAYPPFGGTDGSAPDFFVLHAVGKDLNGNVIDTLDFYLADFRSGNPADDYILKTWEWFDLSSLGNVGSIAFSLESSVVNQSGMVTPAYFCMDDFNGTPPAQPHVDQPPYVVAPVADIVSDVFPDTMRVALTGVVTDDDSPVDSIAYSLLANSNMNAVEVLVENNSLVITRRVETADTAVVTVRATSGDLYVDFEVHVILNHVVGVREEEMVMDIYPNPTTSWLNVVLGRGGARLVGARICLFDVYGRLMAETSSEASQGTVAIDLSSCVSGIYLLKVIDRNGQTLTTRKVMKR